MPMRSSLAFLFHPKSIAVIGASNRPGKLGHEILRNLLEGGFSGRVYPVNPKGGRIFGLKVYQTLDSLPESPDLALIVLPPAKAVEAFERCGRLGVKAAIIFSSGFSEVGNEELEGRLIETCEKYGIRLLGPNCAGVINAHENLYATMEVRIAPGPVSMVAQSGALGGIILALCEKQGIGVSKFVSYGNACDIDESEVISYLAEDPETEVILVYIEGVKNGRKFLSALREAVRKKPVIVLKGGKTGSGSRAARSHTAALAGDNRIFQAALRQAGAIQAENIEEMLDLAQVFLSYSHMHGNRVCIVTNSGGPAVVAADHCEEQGLKLPPPTQKLLEKLEFLPHYCPKSNPIDLTAEADGERYRKTLEAVIRSGEYDGILVIFVPPFFVDVVDTTQAVIETAWENRRTPIVACWTGTGVEKCIEMLREAGIPTYTTPQKAAKALKALWTRNKTQRKTSFGAGGGI